jgi:hypothetical protein
MLGSDVIWQPYPRRCDLTHLYMIVERIFATLTRLSRSWWSAPPRDRRLSRALRATRQKGRVGRVVTDYRYHPLRKLAGWVGGLVTSVPRQEAIDAIQKPSQPEIHVTVVDVCPYSRGLPARQTSG